MLAAYRIAYGVVVILFLGNRVATDYCGAMPLYTSLLIGATKVCPVILLVVLVAFSRVKPPIPWGVVLAWECLFIWYAWFSPAAPVALYETHAVKLSATASERIGQHAYAGALFVGLFLWFLSLGIVRSLEARLPRGKTGDRIPFRS